MNLIIIKSIDYPASRLFQTLRPSDIILLVKPGTQLNKHRYLFSVFRCRTEIFHKPCFPCQPVDRNLNRHDIGVCRCLLNKLQERIHALIRIKKQNILALDLLHQAPILYTRRVLRCKRLIRKGTLHGFRKFAAYGKDIGKLHRNLRPEDLIRTNLKSVTKILFILRGKLLCRLQTHH